MAAENKKTSISQATNYEEIAEFWDTHSLADFEDQTYEVALSFDPAARHARVNIEPELFQELQQLAQERRVSIQTLVNLWLQQRVDQIHISPTP